MNNNNNSRRREKTKMKIALSCSICQTNYDESQRVPLTLQCGHSFCKLCLSRLFSSTPSTAVSCPGCRHVSAVGNSISALPKNFPLLSLLRPNDTNSDAYSDTDDEDGDARSVSEDGGDNGNGNVQRCFGVGFSIDMSRHRNLRLIEKFSEGRRVGAELWKANLSGKGCGGHVVAVKRVKIGEGMDVEWVQGELEKLRRASMWCRNVCSYHGAIVLDGYICLVMDKSSSSVEIEMQKNGGRLTLEQILRFGADIARGVAELHAAGVVCMNLKPSNFLLDANYHVIVSDYGHPLILRKSSCRKAREIDSLQKHLCIECMLLSPNYTAPEAWEPAKRSLPLFREDAAGISLESDAWSFGCALVEMCTGSTPWAGLNAQEIYRAVVKDRRLPPQYSTIVGAGIPTELWKMIGDCLQFKASKRPAFNDMLAIFLRHLRDIPRSHPDSPINGFAECPEIDTRAKSPTSVLDAFHASPNYLHQLVSEGDQNGVRDLLAKAASTSGSSSILSLLEARDADGQTALHLACRRGCLELVEAILEYSEADPNLPNKDGNPPIVFSLAAGSLECARALIRKSPGVVHKMNESLGSSVAHVCAYNGHPDCMREILLAGADPYTLDDNNESILHVALANKFTECAISILENGGCRLMGVLNSNKITPLHLCVEMLNVTVVKRWAEVATMEEIAEAIDIASSVGTALCMAAALKKDREPEGRELVKILLSAGADVNSQDCQYWRTALHTAAMANDVELVKIILDFGVDVNIRNVNNTIPLHLALAKGAKPCVELLLSSGADCNLQDDDGDNAFHIAADAAKLIRENLECLVFMLQYPDAAVETRNHSGKTLCDLLEALPREWISEDLVEALMEKGVHLSPTIYQPGDWVKFTRKVVIPTYGWQGAMYRSVGFVRTVLDSDNLVVSFCSGVAHVLTNEVIKVIPLDRGQLVRIRTDIEQPRYPLTGLSLSSIGTVLCVDDDGIVRIGFTGASRGWQADPAELQRVEEFKIGDWVRVLPTLTVTKHGLGAVTPGSIGVVCCIRPDHSLVLEFSYLSNPWLCEPEEVESVTPFRIGDRVCVKRSVAEPRFAWGGETHHSVGRIIDIESNGFLIIEIPNRARPWKADPSDMEKVDVLKVGDWVRVKASVPSPKYGWEDINRLSIGIVHSLDDGCDVHVEFCFRTKHFMCSVTDLEKVSPFEVGLKIRIMPSVSQPQLGWSNESAATTGEISSIDMDGTLNVKVAGRTTFWKVAPSDAERLPEFKVNDWVRVKQFLGNRPNHEGNVNVKDSIAVVHSTHDIFHVELTSCFRRGRWEVHYSEIEKVEPFKVGQHVCFRSAIIEPRWGWRGVNPNSRGIIVGIDSNGELKISFSGLPQLWRGDPADLQVEQIFQVGEWVELKEDSGTWKSIGPGSIGIVQGVGYLDNQWDGNVLIAFCGEQELWAGPNHKLKRAEKLVIGQRVRVKPTIEQPRFGWSGHSHSSVGTITGIDADGKLRMFAASGSRAWMLDPWEVEVVIEEKLRVGDWVRVKKTVSNPTHHWGEVNHKSIGVVHRIEEGDLWVSFCFLDRLWVCKEVEMERVRAFQIGDRAKFLDGLVTPRWGWGMETPKSKGEVVGVDANGKLRITFKWRNGRPWVGDPADICLDED
ncbi:E3 ubiquitin-protein ligase KEG-like [Impatiens glandulifera]|uniref:E3 ubiquitin-protein ligase KEG-like n=1 Tax=Impatiens glandulifera TaxID=253017 RepID=UPI001FB16A92|nr:E3 ubiquitin-protein ligase KEG-like [Impatiens glandulifera]